MRSIVLWCLVGLSQAVTLSASAQTWETGGESGENGASGAASRPVGKGADGPARTAGQEQATAAPSGTAPATANAGAAATPESAAAPAKSRDTTFDEEVARIKQKYGWYYDPHAFSLSLGTGVEGQLQGRNTRVYDAGTGYSRPIDAGGVGVAAPLHLRAGIMLPIESELIRVNVDVSGYAGLSPLPGSTSVSGWGAGLSGDYFFRSTIPAYAGTGISYQRMGGDMVWGKAAQGFEYYGIIGTDVAKLSGRWRFGVAFRASVRALFSEGYKVTNAERQYYDDSHGDNYVTGTLSVLGTLNWY